MEKKAVLESLKKAREARKRNFEQKVDIIINLRDLDLKKSEHQVDVYTILPKDIGNQSMVCAFVPAETAEDARSLCDGVVTEEDFPKYAADKKLMKKLSGQYDYFISHAAIMTKVAKTFGRVLGPRGKMPNPKVGAVFPQKTPLSPLCERLKKTIRLSAKLTPTIHCMVGKETMSDDDIAENILAVYEQVVHHLPKEAANIRSVYVKLTMGGAVKLR